MLQADRAWREELSRQSIGDVVRSLAASAPPVAAGKGMAWLGGVLARRPVTGDG